MHTSDKPSSHKCHHFTSSEVLVAGQVLSVQAGPVLESIAKWILMDRNICAFSLSQLLARRSWNKAELHCSESQKAHHVTERTGWTIFSIRCHVSTPQMLEYTEAIRTIPALKGAYGKDLFIKPNIQSSSEGLPLAGSSQRSRHMLPHACTANLC